ncbi:uncharacterized protein LOC128255817 [Drosophila gunungcola]|uniref:Uncharacterized protein n=1 Tax=Drosophila gunungcola TaxID=103775 RepID=A0A9P9YHP6_9MUSC|nr:uncharacterized protein LOC128255817 [Drosophila gunungcola]KAI8037137.1 hypothetical protein M5D96_009884 [Drosophila gunungcola]
MLDILNLWFVLYLLSLSFIQGRSVGGGTGNLREEFLVPQPDPTIFAHNQTDKEMPWGS